MKCKADVMYTTCETGLSTLSKGLKKLKTAPSLLEAIIQGIRCWTDDVKYDLDDCSTPLLFSEGHTQLLKVQSDIGWDNFLKGYLGKEWGNLQESYYRSIKANALKFTRIRWVVKTLSLIHEYRTSCGICGILLSMVDTKKFQDKYFNNNYLVRFKLYTNGTDLFCHLQIRICLNYCFVIV
jgi:hypothetical protein